MKNFIVRLLKNNLPDFYFYHDYLHTLYVEEKALEIGRHEGCSDEELKLLSIAALWHDTGYIKLYKHHEEESCLMARKYLPEYGLSSSDIEKVCGMIMATKIPQNPTNKLEEIIADADLEYLGTPSFEFKSDCLFRELLSVNAKLTETKWNQMQISFLQEHHYFTRFCIENRDPVKQTHLNELLLSTL